MILEIFKELKEGVMAYLPPELSPEQRLQAEAALDKILESSATKIDERIAKQEGTAQDLLNMPILGKCILFARGAQRPVWGFATLAMDFMWFFGDYPHEFNEQQQTTLIIINSLVLGFLFGERAVLNLTPLITKLLAK